MVVVDRRRGLLAMLGCAMLGASTACDKEPKPSTTATLTNNEGVHTAVKALVNAVDSLQSNVEQFGSENWREVVPNVRTSASEVESALSCLRAKLGYSD